MHIRLLNRALIGNLALACCALPAAAALPQPHAVPVRPVRVVSSRPAAKPASAKARPGAAPLKKGSGAIRCQVLWVD